MSASVLNSLQLLHFTPLSSTKFFIQTIIVYVCLCLCKNFQMKLKIYLVWLQGSPYTLLLFVVWLFELGSFWIEKCSSCIWQFRRLIFIFYCATWLKIYICCLKNWKNSIFFYFFNSSSNFFRCHFITSASLIFFLLYLTI